MYSMRWRESLFSPHTSDESNLQITNVMTYGYREIFRNEMLLRCTSYPNVCCLCHTTGGRSRNSFHRIYATSIGCGFPLLHTEFLTFWQLMPQMILLLLLSMLLLLLIWTAVAQVPSDEMDQTNLSGGICDGMCD